MCLVTQRDITPFAAVWGWPVRPVPLACQDCGAELLEWRGSLPGVSDPQRQNRWGTSPGAGRLNGRPRRGHPGAFLLHRMSQVLADFVAEVAFGGAAHFDWAFWAEGACACRVLPAAEPVR